MKKFLESRRVLALRAYLRKTFERIKNERINYVEFSIHLDANSTELPLAQVRYELAKLGATGIETIPLESSIPGLNAIDF